MRSELQQRKKSDKIKWIATALAVVILSIGVMAAITQGFTDWNRYGWFEKKQEQPADSTETPETPDSGGTVTGEVVGNGIKMMSATIEKEDYVANGIYPMAETAYMLTATIQPSNATNQLVDWAIAFANPASEWAMGKTVTDYVTIKPTVDGSLTARVECLQMFGEQVKITVTSRSNPEATAEVAVEYAKRISEVNCKLNKGLDGAGEMIFSTYQSDLSYFHYLKPNNDISSSYNKFSYEYTTGVGTLEDEFDFSSVLRFSDEFVKDARASLSSLNIDFSYEKDHNALTNTGSDFLIEVFGESVMNDGAKLDMLVNYLNNLSNKLSVYNAGVFSLELKFTGKYSSYQKVVPILISTTDMFKSVSFIVVDDSLVVF